MTRQGCDFAELPHPTPAGLRAAGLDFVVRYFVGYSTIPGKPVQVAEVAAYAAAGIDVVANWERSAKAMLGGFPAGQAAATEALKIAANCGMPAGRPVYYSADWAVSAGEQAAVNEFLRGAAARSPGGVAQVGIYGSYDAVRRALDAGACRWAWQTYAWSGGRWDPRAQLRQTKNGVTVAGADVDLCTAVANDFGQWRPGFDPSTPSHPPEDDMPFSCTQHQVPHAFAFGAHEELLDRTAVLVLGTPLGGLTGLTKGWLSLSADFSDPDAEGGLFPSVVRVACSARTPDGHAAWSVQTVTLDSQAARRVVDLPAGCDKISLGRVDAHAGAGATTPLTATLELA